MKNKHLVMILAIFSLISFYSCTKDNSGNTDLSVKLTDAPAAFDAVNVDVREVRVNFRDDSTGWINLNTNAHVYNLLALQGVDTLLASGTVTAGNLKQIRLILGTDNSIVVGGISYPLMIPSGSESGLKININKKISEGSDSLVIDFDAALSVKLEPGGYKLRPVIKLK
jgi:hypothetical protein